MDSTPGANWITDVDLIIIHLYLKSTWVLTKELTSFVVFPVTVVTDCFIRWRKWVKHLRSSTAHTPAWSYYSRPSLIRTTLIRTLANPNELRLSNIHYCSIVHTCELHVLVGILHVGQFVLRNVHNTCRTVVVWTSQQFMAAANMEDSCGMNQSTVHGSCKIKWSHKTLDHWQQTGTTGAAVASR